MAEWYFICQEGCLGPKLSFRSLGGAKLDQMWCIGFNIGITLSAECLGVLFMFLKGCKALLVFCLSKGIFCHYTDTGGGYKQYPGPFLSNP